MTKRIAQVVFGILLTVGLIAGGALIFITSDFGSIWISTKLSESLKRQTGLDVSFNKIDLEFFPPRLVLRELTVTGPKKRVGCTVEEAEAAPDPLDLFRAVLSIEEIYMGSPQCTINLDESAIDELEEASRKSDSRDEGINLDFLPSFDVVALSDGAFSVNIDDPGRLGQIAFQVDGLYLDITGGQKNIEIRGLIERAHGKYKKDDVTIDEKLSQLGFRAALNEEAVDVRKLEGTVAGVELKARDIFIPIPIGKRDLKAVYFSVDVPLDLFSRLPLETPKMKGTAGFSGQVSVGVQEDGKPTGSARGHVRLRDVSVDDVVVGDLDGSISLGQQGVSFADVDLRTASGHIRASGDIEFNDKLSIHSKLTLEKVELARLLENVTMDGAYVEQRMSGQIAVNGSLRPFNLKGQTRLSIKDHNVYDGSFRAKRKKRILHIPQAQVSGRFTVNDKHLAADGFTVKVGDSSLAVDMDFGFSSKKGWRLHAKSNQLDLGELKSIAGIPIGGRGSLEATIVDPTYGTPKITGHTSMRRLHFAGFDFSNVETDVKFDGRRLMFDKLHVTSPKSEYSSKEIELDFGAKGGLDIVAKIDAQRIAVQDVAKSFHLDTSDWGSPKGYASGRVAIAYSQGRDIFKVEAQLEHEGLSLFNEVFGPESIDVVWENSSILVNRFGLTKGNGSILLTGAMNKDEEMNFMAVATNIQIEDIVYPPVSDLELEGKVQAFAILEGTPDKPIGRVDIRLSETVRKGMTYGPTSLELELNGSVLSGKGDLAGDLATLEYGMADFEKDTFLLEAFVHGVNLAEFAGLEKLADRTQLNITGEMSLRGQLSTFTKLGGHVNLDQVELVVNDLSVVNQKRLVLQVEKDLFKLKKTRFQGDNILFDLNGNANRKRMRLAINGLANMRGIAQLTDTVRSSSGKLAYNAIFSGPWSDPKFRGEAKVSNGSFMVKGFPNRIEDVTGEVHLGAKTIQFNNFEAKSAGGEINMDGWIAFEGTKLKDYRFTSKLSDLEIQLMEDLRFRASTKKNGLLLAPGKIRDLPTITGDVEISDFRYTEEIRIVELSDLSMDRFSGKQRHTRRPKLFDKRKDIFAYDIQLHGDRNLKVKNNIVEGSLKIDDEEDPLRLVGTNQTYGFLGRVMGTKGQVRFAGKTFEIRYASVSFKDPLRPENPHFRITADVEIRDWKVTIIAEGTVDEYEVKLSSQPYLSYEDVVILLLTGMTKAEHAQYGSQGLSGSLASILGSVSGTIIPVEVNIYSEYSQKAQEDTTRVALGKRITEDLWVQISSSLGQERDVEGMLEYRINDNFSVSANYDNANEISKSGNWGVDLKFRLEF